MSAHSAPEIRILLALLAFLALSWPIASGRAAMEVFAVWALALAVLGGLAWLQGREA